MYSNKIKYMLKFLLYVIAVIIQVAFIVAVFVIEYLTTKKAGVMRHVYTMGLRYKDGIYSPNNLFIQSIIAIVLITVFTIMSINYPKDKNQFINTQIILGIVISTFVVAIINIDFFSKFMSYHYIIMVSEIILLIQIFIIYVSVISGKRKV